MKNIIFIKNSIRYIVFVSILTTLYLLLTTTVVYAQGTQTVPINQNTPWYLGGFGDRGKALNSAKNKANAEATYQFGFNQLLYAAITSSAGITGGEASIKELSQNIQKSALGQSSNLISALYLTPPARSSEYFADLFNRSGLVPQTYAQGVTYTQLLPLLPIWKTLRDLSYVLLSVVMLMIGVMIMFRHKVNAQTVANIENTIPNVLLTVVLITFSFPIATLMIDFMYVAIAAGVGIIGSAVHDQNVNNAIKDFTTGGFFQLFGHTLAPVGNLADSSTWGGFGTATGVGLGLMGLAAIGGPVTWVGALIAILAAGLLGGGVGGAVGGTNTDWGAGFANMLSPLFIIMILVVLFFSIFRIFFMLLTSYLQIMLYIIFSPILLLFNAIPGQNSFSNWWKTIASHLSVFVTTAVLLYTGWAISYVIRDKQGLWTAPMVAVPGLSQMAVGLVAIGISLLTPQLVKKIQGLFNVKPILSVGPSMVLNPFTSSVSQGYNLLNSFHTESMASKVLEKIPFISTLIKKAKSPS